MGFVASGWVTALLLLVAVGAFGTVALRLRTKPVPGIHEKAEHYGTWERRAIRDGGAPSCQ